jgi:hypothetical protein
LIFKPSMIATMLLPARFDSTYCSENECSDVGWKAMDSVSSVEVRHGRH